MHEQGVQQHLALILEHVGDGLTVQEPGGRLIFANAAAAEALGFASAGDLLATPPADIVARFEVFDEEGQRFPPDRLPGRRALAGEREPSATLRFRARATGEERWSHVRASPVFAASGEVQFAVNVWQDITARKRDEETQRFLAEASEALSGSLDVEATLANIARLAVPRLADWCAVHLVRDDRTVAQVSVAHVDPERVAWALQLQEQYPPDPEANRGVYRVARTGQPELIPDIADEMLVAVARDPEHLAMLRRVGLTSGLIAPMVARGRVLGTITFAAAESGRRLDERDLGLALELARRAALAVENARLYDVERLTRSAAEAAQARFRALFEGVPDAILVVDAEGRCLEANAAANQLLGYAGDALLDVSLDDLAVDGEVARGEFSILGQTTEWRGESAVRHRDGTLVPVEIWSRRHDLPGGPIAVAVLRDISERRAADQAREEVLAAISHDLRSPLGSIKLQAQSLHRLLRRGDAIPPDRLDESLTAIESMATRVTFLLDDIVDVARTAGGEPAPLHPESTDLVELVHRCALEAGTSTGRTVDVQAANESLQGFWDPRALERTVLNLVNNALKYSPADAPVQVRIERSPDAAWAELTVRDQGIGIPVADLPRIFERYRRGRNVGTVSGTGLGLTGARQMVERHGGTISIASKEGKGTAVTVRLPLHPPAEGDG